MRYAHTDDRYNEPFTGKCWEMWHAELRNGPFCGHLDLGHEGPHQGNGMTWDKECLATIEQAQTFLSCYRRIPNSNHSIWLNDDGSVGMTLDGFAAATRFLGVHGGDD